MEVDQNGQNSPSHRSAESRPFWALTSRRCLEHVMSGKSGGISLCVTFVYTCVYIYIIYIYIFSESLESGEDRIWMNIDESWIWMSMHECGCIWNMDIKRHDITQILIYTLYFHIHSTSDWLRLYLVDSFNYFWQLLFSSYFRDEAIHVSGNPWRVYVVSFMSYVYLPVI